MTRREHRDPYVVLGVGRQASAAEIAHAFRRAARDTHPDTSAGSSESAERFRAVSDAYQMLRDPQRRAAYDRAHPSVNRAAGPPGRAAYASPDPRHIVLGAPPAFGPGRVEVSPPRGRPRPPDGFAAARLIVSLLLADW